MKKSLTSLPLTGSQPFCLGNVDRVRAQIPHRQEIIAGRIPKPRNGLKTGNRAPAQKTNNDAS